MRILSQFVVWNKLRIYVVIVVGLVWFVCFFYNENKLRMKNTNIYHFPIKRLNLCTQSMIEEMHFYCTEKWNCVSQRSLMILSIILHLVLKKKRTHTHTVSRSQVHTYTGTLSLDADTHVSHCCLFKFSNWLINKRPNVRETNYSRSIDNRLL